MIPNQAQKLIHF